MINGKTVLAVIPARGGSRRCPRKNILPFRGKPLIAWTIEAARQSKYIDTLILSTDDEEIAGVANSLGVSVLMRPAYLAKDDSTSEDVLRHALDFFPCYWMVLLQPTSPLRIAQDIDACLELCGGVHASVSVVKDGNRNKKNGAVYVGLAEEVENPWFSFAQRLSEQYEMPADRSLDIDLPEQFQ